MTPNAVQALIGLWRRVEKEESNLFHAEDVAVEVALHTGKTFGKTRALNALRSLVDLKMVKESKWNGFSITVKGKKFCEALQEMGLCRFV